MYDLMEVLTASTLDASFIDIIFITSCTTSDFAMSSFFDVIADEDDQLPSPAQTRWSANAHASSSRDRESSIVSSSSLDGNGSRSFLSRLESTISPNGKTDRYTSVGIESVLGEDIDDGLGGRGIGGKELELGLDGEEDDDLDDVNRMGRVWVRERGTTGIMRWEGDLIDNLLDKLEQQVRQIIADIPAVFIRNVIIRHEMRLTEDGHSKRWSIHYVLILKRQKRNTSSSCLYKLKWNE